MQESVCHCGKKREKRHEEQEVCRARELKKKNAWKDNACKQNTVHPDIPAKILFDRPITVF
jgi:hypothetical protein